MTFRLQSPKLSVSGSSIGSGVAVADSGETDGSVYSADTCSRPSPSISTGAHVPA